MGDLGFGWDRRGAQWGGMVEVLDPALQAAIADLRTAGLNIMMSMKDAGKPVLRGGLRCAAQHLADYTRLTEVFEKQGTRGTWYAHAAEGCLHVRPILNLREDKDVKAMRAIAEEAFALVKAYKGSHSGEHGDGIVRSEFHEMMFGTRLVRAFEEVKDRFDRHGLYNPGRRAGTEIRRPPLFPLRAPLCRPAARDAARLVGVSRHGRRVSRRGRGNNNGACRKLEGGVMCPSYRVTRNERDVTRGRANTLRLAITGQLGLDALTSDEMTETLKLCVSCKGCRRECPTGVDMARMKIEVLTACAKHGYSLRDRLVGWLPRYAPVAARLALLNARDRLPGAARLSEIVVGLSARRALPRWRRDVFAPKDTVIGPTGGARSCCSPTPSTAISSGEPRCGTRSAHRRWLPRAPRDTARWRTAAVLRAHFPVRRRR